MAGQFAVLHPDARLPYKRWTMNGWIDVIQYLTGQGIRVYVTGGPAASEQEYIDELLETDPNSAQSIAGPVSNL